MLCADHHCDRYRRAVELACRTWGVVGRAQLVAAGIPASTIDSWLRRGMLRSVHRCVFAVGHDVLRGEGLFYAAVLAGGEGAALSHGSAAHHLDLRRSSARLVDVSVLGSRRAAAGIRFHRPRHFEPGDVIVHDGIPTTSPSRTIIDLAATLPRRQLENLVAAAERRDLLDHGRLARARSAALASILGTARLTRSEDEERFLAGLRAAGLPEPETNVWLTHGGGEEWEADLLYRRERVIIEIDDDSHRTGVAFERDRAKDVTRQVEGYATLRFTRRQVRQELSRCVAKTARLVAARATALRQPS